VSDLTTSPTAQNESAESAPRRRRRATAPAGRPTPVEELAPVVSATVEAEPALEGEPLEDEEGAELAAVEPAAEPVAEPVVEEPVVEQPAAPRRRRRAAAPAGAPVVAAPAAETLADAPAPAAAEPAAEAVEPAAPARARRSRAKKAVVAEPAEQTAVQSTDQPAAPAGEVAADQPAPAAEGAPAKRPARRRRSGAAATEAVATETAATESAATESADAPAASSAQTPRELDVLAELGAAGMAVLFQAPEPVRGRRRAQAPAGAPRPVADEPPAGPTAGEAEAGVEDAADAPAPATSSRGRRRRGRGADAAAPTAAPAEDADELEAEGADADEADDAADEDSSETGDGAARRRRRRRGGRGRRRTGGEGGEGTSADGASAEDAEPADDESPAEDEDDAEGESGDGSRRRRRRRRSGRSGGETERAPRDEVTALKGSTRLEAKRQRRREGRDAGRRRAVITEAEFLARREAVERSMVVREIGGRIQIGVLEDGVLVEHFVSRAGGGHGASMIGNVYLGRVQNVLPSMEAAFVDIGKGRNAVLYAGEVNWDAAGLEGQPRRIEQALKSGDQVLVQVTKDPIGHKGARLTSQVTLAGRYLVYVPAGGMTGISRKLPENERARLKKLLREIVPDGAGVIVRTAAEGASEEELRLDVKRLQDQWAAIERKLASGSAPQLLQGEPDLAIRVVRDIFNDDFSSLVVQGDEVYGLIRDYVESMAPDLMERLRPWTGTGDAFAAHRIDEQLAKAMDRKVWLPSGGSLVIDRTEAMTVIDVNTGKFTGTGGTLEETVTRNNLEAAEEIVRQLRLRDVGGIIVIDFIDMVLESNRDLVLRRLVECLGRDRTKHQVAEVTSLGLVQMTRKRVGQGLLEAFSETCQHCAGRGYLVRTDPVEVHVEADAPEAGAPEPKKARRKRGGSTAPAAPAPAVPVLPEAREAVKATLATIAAAAAHAHEHPQGGEDEVPDGAGVESAEVAEHVEEAPEPAEQE
jgi:ribonuclease E